MHPVVVLMGPTASGKSQLAIDLYSKYPDLFEIISVDSVMVYRQLDIGSAKPSIQVRATIPHHMIDIADIDEGYSAGLFCRDVEPIVSDIMHRGRIPLFVGGSMMYLHACLQGLSPVQSSQTRMPHTLLPFSHGLNNNVSASGCDDYEKLIKIDPKTRIHPHDVKRVRRALDIYAQHGSLHIPRHKPVLSTDRFHLHVWKLEVEIDYLAQSIEHRVEQMWCHGFLDEVAQLMRARSLTHWPAALNSIGYRECIEYLNGKRSLSETKCAMIQATRRLAKHQRTWMKKMPGTWISPKDWIFNVQLKLEII